MNSGFVFFDENTSDFEFLKNKSAMKLICDFKNGLGADAAVFVMPPDDKANNSCKIVCYDQCGEISEANAAILSCVAHSYLSQRGGKSYASIETKSGLKKVFQKGIGKTEFEYEVEFEAKDLNKPTSSEALELSERNGKTYALCSVQELAYGYLSGVFINKLKELSR